MMWWDFEPAGWAWMIPGLVLFWVFVVGFILLMFGATRTRRDQDQALHTLRGRLAAGEITREEYEQTRKLLLG